MMRSMFAAISGLKAHQVMLDVTAADIANVNTLGYKASRMTFRDSLSQLQHQDPMEPANDTEFIGQMAQFSALEQESNTAQSTSQMADQLGRAGALGLIGKTVTYADADGNPQSGVVQQVDIGADGAATLTVGGKGGIDAGSVTQVK